MVAAAALAAVVAALVIMQSVSSGSAANGTTGAMATTSPPDARRQAAVRLAGLLALSGTDRAAVTRAAEDVRGCGPSLHQDAQTFAHSASSRQQLLSRLATLAGRAALPAALLADLTSAWQASAQVDTDLARWARDNIARGCRHGSRSDTYLRASAIPESQATAGKRAFATRWKAIARAYDLTTYQPSQL